MGNDHIGPRTVNDGKPRASAVRQARDGLRGHLSVLARPFVSGPPRTRTPGIPTSGFRENQVAFSMLQVGRVSRFGRTSQCRSAHGVGSEAGPMRYVSCGTSKARLFWMIVPVISRSSTAKMTSIVPLGLRRGGAFHSLEKQAVVKRRHSQRWSTLSKLAHATTGFTRSVWPNDLGPV